MMYRAKVTNYFPAIKSVLVDLNPSYVHDRTDVYVEVHDLELACYLDKINSMTPEQITAVLGFVSYMVQNIRPIYFEDPNR